MGVGICLWLILGDVKRDNKRLLVNLMMDRGLESADILYSKINNCIQSTNICGLVDVSL